MPGADAAAGGGAWSAAAGWKARAPADPGLGTRAPLGRFKYQLATALGVGAVAGVAAYFAGPWLAGAAGAVGGFAAAVAVQAGLALKRLIARAAGSAA